MTRQCSSCGGFCKKSGCERENVAAQREWVGLAGYVVVNVASQFTKLPGLRHKRLCRFSGEEFRQRFLLEPLKQGRTVIVELDGVQGYSSSFLEEAFGGTVRELDLEITDALNRIKTVTSVESWRLDVEEYIKTAKTYRSQTEGEEPMKEPSYHCPSCESDQVTTEHHQMFMVNTLEHYCHSMKTQDDASPAKCLDCGWTGLRQDLKEKL